MKTLSERSDIVVFGSGLAGICAAVSAAREGAVVRLVDERACVGGRIGNEIRFPFDFKGTTNFAYQRETGILDEILFYLSKHNLEGNYCGLERSLNTWIREQKRLEIFSGTQLFEVRKNKAGDKIESVVAISNKCGERILFRSPYYIDCTRTGVLTQLASAPGENGLETGEYLKSTASSKEIPYRCAATMEIGLSETPVAFNCPPWVSLKWEDNHQLAKIDLLESLSKELLGIHNVEWLGKTKNEFKIESADLIWSAWDYLKNRSPLVERARHLVVECFSPLTLSSQGFRAKGEYLLSPEDMESGKEFYDSVSLGRSPLDLSESLLCSPRGKIALPQPFEIPLRSLFSSKIKNLLFAGEHISSTSRASASFSHPPTSSQMGAAVGVCAAVCIEKKRLPRTMSKQGNIDIIRKRLARTNHTCALYPVEDLDNQIPHSKIVSSSSLGSFVGKGPFFKLSFIPNRGLLQFPIISESIEGIHIYLECSEDSEVGFRLLQGSSTATTIPGECLESTTQLIRAGGVRWERIFLNSNVKRKGWHFLEFTKNNNVSFYEYENVPTGILCHHPLKSVEGGLHNPYSEFCPKLPNLPGPSTSIALEIEPKQKVYLANNVQNEKNRPDCLPNLWISEETDFRFPEFIEFHWEENIDISSIDIVWDASLEYLYPARPEIFSHSIPPSIVRDYKIYYMNEVGHWQDLIEVFDNGHGFSRHTFENINTQAIEIEILSTHGLNRAQVYQVRAYS